MDPQAYVAHAGTFNVDLKAQFGGGTLSAGAPARRSSCRSRHGTVYVQASEQKF